MAKIKELPTTDGRSVPINAKNISLTTMPEMMNLISDEYVEHLHPGRDSVLWDSLWDTYRDVTIDYRRVKSNFFYGGYTTDPSTILSGHAVHNATGAEIAVSAGGTAPMSVGRIIRPNEFGGVPKEVYELCRPSTSDITGSFYSYRTAVLFAYYMVKFVPGCSLVFSERVGDLVPHIIAPVEDKVLAHLLAISISHKELYGMTVSQACEYAHTLFGGAK